jgi:hypothetical protein
MKILMIIIVSLLAMPTAVSAAAEQYMCYRISDEGNGVFRQDTSEYVALSVDRETIQTQIHINAATKDLTFLTCKHVTADGSNFSTWFKNECRHLKAIDGSPYTVEPYLLGAYAGISPIIDERSPMFKAIQSASKKAGVTLPDLTFAIYADRKPLYEFFCNRQETPLKP